MARDSSCRCGAAERLRGDEARSYLSGHLLAREITDIELDELSGVDVACPSGLATWNVNHYGRIGELELRRLPVISAVDLLDRSGILERAATVEEADADIRRWFRVDEIRWHDATFRAWQAREALYSNAWVQVERDLQAGDIAAVEPAVVFLEADPWCFRSGYAKGRVLRYLSRMQLDEPQRSRLRDWLVDVIPKGPRRELPMMLRLARHVADDGFAGRLSRLAEMKPAAAPTIEKFVEATSRDEGAPR